MNFSKLALSKKVRDERMIKNALDEERERMFSMNVKFYFKTNVSILTTIFEQCPANHLIVIGRTCGTAAPDTFEQSIENLINSIKPDDCLQVERCSCRVIINPANCKDVPSTIISYNGYYGGNDIINRWEFVPYPKHWSSSK